MSQPAPSAVPPTASQPGQSLLPDSTGLFTTANFVIIAVLALLVVLGLIYGARLRKQRREAHGELTEHNDALRAEGVTETPVTPDGEQVVAEAPPPVEAVPSIEHLAGALGSKLAPPLENDRTTLADDPIAAAAPFAENPASEKAPPTPPGPSPADGPVTQLKGLGPRVAERLAGQGITTVGQLAALTDDEASALDAHLGPFTGRMARDRWLEQARFLAAGDKAGFEAVFGRL